MSKMKKRVCALAVGFFAAFGLAAPAATASWTCPGGCPFDTVGILVACWPELDGSTCEYNDSRYYFQSGGDCDT